MSDDARKQLRSILAVVFLVIALGVAIWSGSRSLNPKPHVVGSLGGDPQGGPTNAADKQNK